MVLCLCDSVEDINWTLIPMTNSQQLTDIGMRRTWGTEEVWEEHEEVWKRPWGTEEVGEEGKELRRSEKKHLFFIFTSFSHTMSMLKLLSNQLKCLAATWRGGSNCHSHLCHHPVANGYDLNRAVSLQSGCNYDEIVIKGRTDRCRHALSLSFSLPVSLFLSPPSLSVSLSSSLSSSQIGRASCRERV